MTRRISLTLFILLVLVTISYAQDVLIPPPNALFTFTLIEEPDEGSDSTFLDPGKMEWMPDSRSFRFPYLNPELYSLPLPSMQYFVETNELRSARAGGCVAKMSQEQALAIDVSDCLRTVSPDGRYTIVATREELCGETCARVLALADLKTGEHVILHAPIYVDYVVRWSENSQAFLMFADLFAGGGIYYVRIPDTLNGLSELDMIHLESFVPGYPSFVDMSPDGWQVLVRGDGDGNILDGLRLWDAHNILTHDFAVQANGQTLFKGPLVSGAAFISDSPGEILVVLERGIVRYNIETREETLINANITAREQRWVYFSPDDQYALVYDDGWHSFAPSNREKRTYLSLFRVMPEE